MIKSRWIRGAEHVALMWEEWSACGILLEKPEGKNHQEDQDVGG
jgi:hypothetical protein